MPLKNDPVFVIRKYSPKDRSAVRRICCETALMGALGDEQSDVTTKYAGTTPIDYTFYYYGQGKARAGDTVNTAMNMSQTQTSSTRPTAEAITADTKSITYYQGAVGDEQSDFTVKYANSAVVDYTAYYYDVSGIATRANGTTTVNCRMSESHTTITAAPWAKNAGKHSFPS